MSDRTAKSDHPVHPHIAQRWSPYAFADRTVAPDDLRSLFEAARWAASSYNEQPWNYIVAVREQPEQFAKVLSCLVEPNQAWAKHAPVLALGIVSRNFVKNGKPNKAAEHDLGAASAQLTFEATARGLVVHQMIGIEPSKARTIYGIPEGFDAHTALAIGYAGESSTLPEALRPRDEAPRQRKPQSEIVFGAKWGAAVTVF